MSAIGTRLVALLLGLAEPDQTPPQAPGPTESRKPAPNGEVRAAFLPPQQDASLPPELTAEFAQIDSIHRSILREPIEHWRFESIRQRYEAMLRSVTDASAGNAIRARLDALGRDEEIAKDARLIESLLEKGRRRDATLAMQRRQLAESQSSQAKPFEVKGLIQPSSRMVGGQKVFALIGGDGSTQAYLDIPPGLDIKGLMTRRVGVRGTVHYNESLRARLINVRDIEPLDKDH